MHTPPARRMQRLLFHIPVRSFGSSFQVLLGLILFQRQSRFSSAVSFLTISKRFSRQMECPKYFISRPHSLPLFPVHRTDSVAEPFIRGLHQAFHVCVPVVVYPPSRISPEFLFPLRVAPLISPYCQLSEMVLHLPD